MAVLCGCADSPGGQQRGLGEAVECGLSPGTKRRWRPLSQRCGASGSTTRLRKALRRGRTPPLPPSQCHQTPCTTTVSTHPFNIQVGGPKAPRKHPLAPRYCHQVTLCTVTVSVRRFNIQVAGALAPQKSSHCMLHHPFCCAVLLHVAVQGPATNVSSNSSFQPDLCQT